MEDNGFESIVCVLTDWNKTSLGQSPIELNMGSMVLPLVLQNFTPNVVAVIGRYTV